MATRYVLTDYVGQAMSEAVYDKLEDGTYTGRIPSCQGVVAFGACLRECEEELRSVLEDWILLGLRLAHPLPVIAGSISTGNLPVSRLTPCRRSDFIRRLRALGFDGPYSGSRHQFMVHGQKRLTIPSNNEYSVPQLRVMMREIELVLGRQIALEEWDSL